MCIRLRHCLYVPMLARVWCMVGSVGEEGVGNSGVGSLYI